MVAPSQHTNAGTGGEEMFRELSKGWTESTLGGVFHWQSGGTPKRTVSEYYGGQIPWAIIGDLNDSIVESTEATLTEEGLNSSTARWVRQGAVLLAMYGSIGKLGIAGIDLTTNQAIAFTHTNVMSNKYLFFFLLANRNELIALGKGDTQSNISQTVIKQFPFLLAPLPEQHRIVAEIEKQFTRLDASVAALKRVQANLKRYRASVLKDACEGKLVPTEAELARAEGRDYEPASVLLERILAERRARWEAQENRRGKYKEPVAPDTTDLPELPEGWVWSRFDQVLSTLEGGTAVSATNTPSNRPVLRSSAVRQGMVDYEDFRYLPDGAKQGPDPYIATGDILFTRLSGTLEYVGNCAVVGELQGRKLQFPDRIFRGRCVSGISPNFIQLAFAEKTLRRSLEAKAKSSAGHQRISLADLREYSIPLPPLTEQNRIVVELERRLSVIQQAESTVEANLTRAERLRQSILKQAFSGNLVPQDPNDEPASVLLGRIRAEREAAEAAAKSQRKPRRRGSKSTRTARPKLSEAAR